MYRKLKCWNTVNTNTINKRVKRDSLTAMHAKVIVGICIVRWNFFPEWILWISVQHYCDTIVSTVLLVFYLHSLNFVKI